MANLKFKSERDYYTLKRAYFMDRIKDHTIIVVRSGSGDFEEINGKEGFIFGKDEYSNLYIVNVDNNEYWIPESQLIDTGKTKILPKNKFDFYEVVKVSTNEEEYQQINDRECPIIGMVQEIDGSWGYRVYFENEESWDVPEHILKKTAKFITREHIFDGSYLRVTQKGKITGGHLTGYDDDEKDN